MLLDGVGSPSEFDRFVFIEDIDDYHRPLFEMMNKSQATINLRDFMMENDYFRQWRWRIEELYILFLDDDYNVINTNSNFQYDAFSVGVTFPTLFNDTDSSKELQTFLGHKYFCRSTYSAFGNHLSRL